MRKADLPSPDVMYRALVEKDVSFTGLFIVGVRTTGIFCRPTCRARKPRPQNTEFFPGTAEALRAGYRPCKLCRPMETPDAPPDWARRLLAEVERDPAQPFRAQDLRAMGLDPDRVRRWFQASHGMTFRSYLRSLRLALAYGHIRNGDRVIDAAYEQGWESLSGFGEAFRKKMGFSPQESSARELIRLTHLQTPLGPMVACATGSAVCLLEFADRPMLETQLKRLRKLFDAPAAPGQSPLFPCLDRQLQEYFAGTRKEFDIPLELRGTPFQEEVWRELLTIPYGQVRSYSRQAKAIGRPEAVRAVARANGDNRLSILVPCHRVVGADGKLTGYGGGLWRKRRLLDLESGTVG